MSKDCTIQDVFHRFYSSFESTHDISPAQRKASYHIMNCKTGAFGVNVSVCEDCGCISVHYNSCRIKGMTESTVTFSAKDYKNQGHWKEISISGEEFIRRFLMHVPPKRFVRIRHYGLLSSRNKKKKITLCRNILGCKKYISKLKDMDAPAILRLLYNQDICKCSSCGGKIIPLTTEQHFIKPKPHMLC